MPFSIIDITYGGAIPAIVAIVVWFVIRRLLPGQFGENYPASISVLVGFLTGYGLLSLAPWTPTAHWHWLPYTMLGAAVIGPLCSFRGLHKILSLLLALLITVLAGWLLVPTWDDLVPSRITYIIIFVAYVAVLASLLEPLSKRVSGRLFGVVLWGTMTGAAIVLAASGSLRFSQIALAGAGALFGCVVVAFLNKDSNPLQGVALLFSTLVVGSLMIGRVNSFSEVSLVSYMLVPLAPLFLWFSILGPLSRLTGNKRIIVHLGMPFVVVAGSVLLAVIADLSGGGN